MKRFLKNMKEHGAAAIRRASADANAIPVLGDETRADQICKKVMSGLFALQFLAPLIVFGLVFFIGQSHVLAQTPGGGIFGASDQTVGNGFKAFLRYFRVIIFFVGFVFMGLVGIMKGIGKPWGGFLAGGLICWGFAGLAQLGYSFATGNEVEITPELGQ